MITRMDDSEVTIFVNLSTLLKKAVIMLEERIKNIESKHPTPPTSSADEEADAVVRLFKARSLRVYQSTLNYIAIEIVREDPKHYFFLLPNTRRLFDIYVRFLHLLENCKNESGQALCCVAYQLKSYHGLKQEKAFNDILSDCKNLLIKESFSFPSFEKFDYKWYLASKLNFKSTHDLFRQEIINKYSTPPVKLFNGKDIVNLYGSVSELCHGNPYFDYEMPYNERFWVITMSFMATSYMIEIIDRYTLKKSLKRDFREWLQEVDSVTRQMTELWLDKNKNNSVTN